MESGGSINASPGFFGDMKQKFRDGQFRTTARWIGVLNVFLSIGLTLMLLSTMIPSALYCLIVGVLVGIIELPFCCTFLPICKKISSYMTFFEIYWIRGLLYILLGCGYLVTFHFMGGFLNLGYGPLFIFDGLLYLLAYCKGETYSKEYDSVSSLGVDTAAIKGKVVAAAMGVM
eukprot:CAMPEP_0172158012 /NCGR_PEP_ID=MMETSP1050-20130122/4130_1 /TAXON_ID=233186 /ORGANISM="Cryptomonas curvata, Strain CCAP979/52" /LENGTH=173 /DNA_ID=CAMNT_0012827345 /DNA_START=44 /DNA_END=565 /DNA_ORIENTATION=+